MLAGLLFLVCHPIGMTAYRQQLPSVVVLPETETPAAARLISGLASQRRAASEGASGRIRTVHDRMC
ncbi:unnamed protein product [Symbiodinium sp. CCMP2592]|nr:unnamed protein product [Symbiodinium sp. CCMP2592]